MLDLEDVLGQRIVETRLQGRITVRQENAAAALETMARFAVDPKWLVYLPPTMSPSETSPLEGFLEHPTEAFAYFRAAGVSQVVCEEKHMGSRAVVIVCRDARRRAPASASPAAERRLFHPHRPTLLLGSHTRKPALLDRLRAAMDAAGLVGRATNRLGHPRLRAAALVRQGPGSSAQPVRRRRCRARLALPDAVTALRAGAQRVPEAAVLLERFEERAQLAGQFVESYRQYCWPVASLDDLKLAPFHLLASEGVVHSDKDHVWHMQTLARLAQSDPLFVATPYRVVDLLRRVTEAGHSRSHGHGTTSDASGASGVAGAGTEADATAWWTHLTGRGGEGMVVKPLHFTTRGTNGRLVQPAVKCRGREYLRIIYGPEYTIPEHLARLRQRGVGAKRALAAREFALGIEALDRFVAREPLRRIHECVFAVLALESEPIDPRL